MHKDPPSNSFRPVQYHAFCHQPVSNMDSMCKIIQFHNPYATNMHSPFVFAHHPSELPVYSIKASFLAFFPVLLFHSTIS
mmetsp:Transcript_31138/g.70073  ORF Transcript_31138/g.70073 Transcript_31138/m.70073 type:complete len:80 (-) Transcript_31138:45-284(-)